ncbi:PQQ-binding-like beta-propeller repeat protein [Roseisolibacter sp. H3M3-2]|uniref:outer membrane protein assembly factor BamB family protein n=1 Tax=Roseisolibacter sp. H3M3-2 TaxID=3031323 RepID=UPI0023DB0921|nr:PQQ-binding-like beta-propeller repeat protein [Roseisolibacter sp. H3M3-2]MDF1503695.1 hypothetical protein [Roseisolibacter sp. H3M3-2]
MRSGSSRRRSSSGDARTTERRPAGLVGAAALALAAAACGGGEGGTTPPPAVVDSTAPVRLEVLPDTVRFTSLFQRRTPTVRLLDLRGRPLDLPGVAWRSEIDTVVRVVETPDLGLVAVGEGSARVIATFERAGGPPLVDTVHAVVTRVITRLALEPIFQGLLVGGEAALTLAARDSGGVGRPLADSLRAQVRWSSTAPGVANVDAAGRVRGVGPGSAVLRAELPSLGLRDSIDVAVLRPYPLPVGRVLSAGGPGPGMAAFVVAPDGETLYHVETNTRGMNTLVASAPDGTERWRRGVGSGVRDLSAGPDGSVFFQDGLLLRGHARDGRELFPAGLPCGTLGVGFALDAEGGIYCARPDSVVAYTAAGDLRWGRAAPGAQSVVLAPGRVYAWGRGITALTRAGERLWGFDAGGAALTVGAVDADGALYFGRLDATLGAVGPDGRLRWQVPDVRGTMAIAPGGTLLVVETGGRRMLSALRTADGVGRWRVFNEAMASGGFPHVGDDGKVYVASLCGVHVFELATGEILGRTPSRACASTGSGFLPNRIYLADLSEVVLVTVPARPGSEWSQVGGNAGRMRGTVP